MTQFDITSLSSKGQVIIPTRLRKEFGIKIGAKFMIFTDGSNILLKPVQSPRVAAFRKLVQASRKLANEKKLKRSDLKEAIKSVRHENRH